MKVYASGYLYNYLFISEIIMPSFQCMCMSWCMHANNDKNPCFDVCIYLISLAFGQKKMYASVSVPFLFHTYLYKLRFFLAHCFFMLLFYLTCA